MKSAKAVVATIRSAVIPVVDADTKTVFLKIVEKAKDDTISTISTTIAAGEKVGLGNDLKAFVNAHPKAAAWSSKASNVKPNLTARSVGNQVAFWKRSGFTVANLKDVAANFGTEIRAKARAIKAKSAEAAA